MSKKRLTYVIPIMIVVMVVAISMLNQEHTEVQLGIRIIIAIGAALFSGVISYFLFPENEKKNRP
ncbi:histidine kinase [Neobacillus mesonae]|uniref:histidine kinase n=1 Tax=Neobacillus mesonae TaxID=1193713 RepID=UPI00203CD267|nr:histidine kinase [Neobacillus mesonae]MCM3569334.1 histidine kinase [Neobacillus mesonae]